MLPTRPYPLPFKKSILTKPPPQPPKKRSAPSSGPAPKRARQSKLAKENDLTGEEENEIKEVFHIFSTTNEEFKNEKEGVIPSEDVRKALVYAPPLSLTS